MNRHRTSRTNGKPSPKLPPTIENGTYAVVDENGLEVAEFGHALEQAMADARARGSGAFVGRQQDRTAMTAPPSAVALSRWQRGGKDTPEPKPALRSRSTPARAAPAPAAPPKKREIAPTGRTVLRYCNLSPREAQGLLDAACTGDEAAKRAVLRALTRGVGGPPRALDDATFARALAMLASGESIPTIAVALKIGETTLRRYLADGAGQ